MKALIIILNYRVTDLTINCLRSLEQEMPRVPGMKVAVVENGTGPDAEQRLRQAIQENGWSDWVQLTAISPNRGFTGGNNVIIREAMTWAQPPDYFILLNADTIVLPGAMEKLVRFMDENPTVGVAGSQLEWPDGKVQGPPFRFRGIATELDSGLRIGLLTKLLLRLQWSMTIDPKPTRACPVDWLAGASMIIRRQVVEAIGPLDEDLYTYYDDIDYCLNAIRAGWPTWYVPESRVVHLEGSSTGIAPGRVKRRPSYWFEARRHFFLKNYGAFYTALVDAAFLIGFALWRVRRVIQRRPDDDPQHMLWDSLRHSVFLTGFRLRPVKNPALDR